MSSAARLEADVPNVNARRRGRSIAAVGLGLMLIIAIVRQFVATDARLPFGAQFLEVPGVVNSLLSPLVLLASLLAELLALSAVSRALEQRRASTTTTALTTALVGVGAMVLFGLGRWLWQGGGSSGLAGVLWGSPLGGLEVYGFWILAFRHPQLVDDARLHELEIARARQAAEIFQLREHLQPHFLRNSLNTIAALLTEDPGEARNLLAALGDLLSDSIASSAPLRSLGEELEWLRRYAEILEARYRGRLTFVWDEDPLARTVLVPRLLLQPLVENAVSHGALAQDGTGRVTVRTRVRAGGGTRVEIEDNGGGFEPIGPAQEGLGLRLVRRRVELESRGTFRLEPGPEGARAIVELG